LEIVFDVDSEKRVSSQSIRQAARPCQLGITGVGLKKGSASDCRHRKEGMSMSIKGRAAILVEPNKPLVIDEIEFPEPAADQVLVKLFSSGVCHSQIHTMRREARPGEHLPALLGHESTGVVVATGRNVRHVKERRPRHNDVGRSQ
jgi:hypothetical protein